MLNISYNSIDRDQVLKNQSAYQQVMGVRTSKRIIYLLAFLYIPFFNPARYQRVDILLTVFRFQGGKTSPRPDILGPWEEKYNETY